MNMQTNLLKKIGFILIVALVGVAIASRVGPLRKLVFNATA